ncbi:hypothetical protein [Desulfovibrio litoralis]|uniref:Uncharacterized protein n=1 Tax=Desulfovibrio litoralis DSM 11393 TaxID=1121455 RepID=A0A1M7TA26_9BACT|nr:hypothetical protein [Desulfovibrio litoralis]SHN67527.1 hypothetical protein SAMN02745728_01759 [Desulfovibrio litoralis DSM 11393]
MNNTFLLKKLQLILIMAFMLLLTACFIESEQPVLKEQEKASALNIFAEKVPDISGTYALVFDKNKKEKYVFSRKEDSANVFFVTDDKGERQNVLVKALKKENTLLIEMSEQADGRTKNYLIPALITKDGLRVFLPAPIDKKETQPWSSKLYLELLDKYQIQYTNTQGTKLLKGAMSNKAYSEAIINLFNDMFAADAVGNGLLLIKE